jgi:hypothetical protein
VLCARDALLEKFVACGLCVVLEAGGVMPPGSVVGGVLLPGAWIALGSTRTCVESGVTGGVNSSSSRG